MARNHALNAEYVSSIMGWETPILATEIQRRIMIVFDKDVTPGSIGATIQHRLDNQIEKVPAGKRRKYKRYRNPRHPYRYLPDPVDGADIE